MTVYSTQQWNDLIDQVKSVIPNLEVGDQAWYILIAAALSTSPSPELLAEFYTHLVRNEESFSSVDQKETLSLQLRDILIKQMTLLGAPQVVMAINPLAAAEGSPAERASKSQLSSKWNTIDRDKIHERGMETIHTIYGHDLLHNRIFPLMGNHTQDIQFMQLFTVYGMYLSDFEQLTPRESELMVFVTISCLGLGLGPSLWHMRGLGRLLGARGTDETTPELRRVKDALRNIKVAMMSVVEFVGEEYLAKAKLNTWPNVGDVVRVLNGWGEDV